ncbi:hypothetical protein [Gordonia spumicola]|uniref:hypothetical protein n=1 Tax=Gordonia spumicola TaxID=589161 RepID=UPI00137A7CF1|nr:hypothetical protein [Gordonia spumicola]
MISGVGGLAPPNGSDGPVHIYPGDPVSLYEGAVALPGSSLLFVPDSPGSEHGRIEWQYTPPWPPGSQLTSDVLTITKNGRPVQTTHGFKNGQFYGTIEDVTAGDVIGFHHETTAVDARGDSFVNVISGADVMPIRIPMPGDSDGGPGQWVKKNESMSDASRYYQEAVTHVQKDWVYAVDGTMFDGFFRSADGVNHFLEARATTISGSIARAR